jgi:hypothetical protein
MLAWRRGSASPRIAVVAVLGIMMLLVSCVGARPTSAPAGASATTVAAKDSTTAGSAGSTVAASSTAAPSTSPTSSAAARSTAPATSAKSATTTAAPGPSPVALAPLPAGGVFDGDRPPQFVLVSFDGAVDPELLTRWEQIAAAAPAHLSFFLSAVYLLGRNVTTMYKGPGHAAGASAIGFAPNQTGAPDADFLRQAVTGLQATQTKGNEVGNHFGGHWCGKGGVDTWKAADWAAELDQVENLVGNVDANNNLVPAVGMPYNPLTVAGARTPCLEGNKDALYPILKARGYRYDASTTRQLTAWPHRKDGLWVYGFPTVTFPGLTKPMIAVDYSISANVDGDAIRKELTPARAKEVSADVLNGYLAAFDSLYYGNRAPFEISNHFNHSDHEAYNDAVAQLMKTVCGKPEVQCVTYSELTNWLDAHAAQLANLDAGKFTKLAKPGT